MTWPYFGIGQGKVAQDSPESGLAGLFSSMTSAFRIWDIWNLLHLRAPAYGVYGGPGLVRDEKIMKNGGSLGASHRLGVGISLE